MRTIGAGITRFAVPVFCALVFVISWGGGLLVVGPSAFPLDAAEFENLGVAVYLTFLAGPSVAGVLLTFLADGKAALFDLSDRLRHWQVAPRWYTIALLPAMLAASMALLVPLIAPDLRPAILDVEDKAGVMLRALVPALMVGAFEEIGWTGFATRHVRVRHSVLTTGLVIGVVWGAWHFPLFWERDSLSAMLPLSILLVRLFSWLPPLRVLLVWTHEQTRSLPVVMLMHAAVSFVSIVLAPDRLTGGDLLTSLLLTAATMWLLLAAITAVNGWRLSGDADASHST